MHAADRVFMKRLITKINEHDLDRTKQVRGGSAQDHADYMNRCGYLRALDDVVTWCNEIAETEDDARGPSAKEPLRPRNMWGATGPG